MPKFSDILHLFAIWGALTLVILAFATIVHSASAYKERKRFWRVLLLTIGVIYLLSALLTLLLHLDAILVAMISLIVAFVIQGDVGIHARDEDDSDESEGQLEISENEVAQEDRLEILEDEVAQ